MVGMSAILAAADAVKAAMSPPTGEQGSTDPALLAGRAFTGRGLPSWVALAPTEHERQPDLQWPLSVQTYRRMLHDPQVTSLMQAIWLPTRGFRFSLDPNGMDPTALALLAADLDLPVGNGTAPTGRRRDRFSFRKHLARALSGLVYGHAVFELVAKIDDQGRWRLVDIAPRPAWTIDQWNVDPQGHLVNVQQQAGIPPITLDADRLCVYSWGGDPGDPRGESLLRSLFGPFVLKDRLVRLDAVTHERNAMGIPVGWMSEDNSGKDRDKMLALLSGIAAGEDVALVLDHGQDMKLRGVEGSTSNVLDSIKYHDEAMARALLAMIVQLGQTAGVGLGGAGAAGSFMDLLGMFHTAVAEWVADTLTEQAVESWVTFNLGPDAPAARVVTERTDAGPATPAANPAPTFGARAPRQLRAVANVNLPPRDLRRQPYEHEAASRTDFAALEAEFVSVRDRLSLALLDARVQYARAAAAHIADRKKVDPATLADHLTGVLAATVIESDRIAALVAEAARNGEHQIVHEAGAQGVALQVTELEFDKRSAAEADGLLARVRTQIAESAAAAARVTAALGTDPAEIAAKVSTHLAGLSTAQMDLAASGATSRAQLAGRKNAIGQAPAQSVYASSLLDTNTCGPCVAIDGTEYPTLDEADRDFPAGGYLGCEGMERCRCTLVAIMDTEQGALT